MAQFLNWRYWLTLFIQREFFSTLEREMRIMTPSRDDAVLRQAIMGKMRELYAANAWRIRHEPDRFTLTWAALVLAAYQTLQTNQNREPVIQLIGKALAAPFIKLSTLGLIFRYGVSPLRPAQAFSRIAPRFRAKGERFFGRSFVFTQDILNDRRSFVSVRQCFFHDFFQGNNAPELTRLFCNLDILFVDELSKPKYRISFERPTALGYGDDRCRFQFTNIGSKT